ncbi:MAG: hypothetical protein E7056_02500 [Lentisphaerae bacterium]|nr:hypothetical protein [Lentisphaerota bacterium]
MSKKVPICLIVDDGGVINTSFFHDLRTRHEFLIPPLFAMQFGQLCLKYGVKGKFSVVPIPCGLGRLDEPDKVNMVPAENVRSFVEYTKKYIAPNFSIAPELLTHLLAWNLAQGGKTQYCEDVFIERLNADEIADYVSLALTVLDNIGLTPSGVSSPWRTGSGNMDSYARGIGMAFKRVLNRDRSFFFCGYPQRPFPTVCCDSPECGRVVHISMQASDALWGTMNPATAEEAHAAAAAGIDSWLSADGKSGALRKAFDANEPMVMLTHWQSLYSEGRGIGLYWFEEFLKRTQTFFGGQLEWVTAEELANRY